MNSINWIKWKTMKGNEKTFVERIKSGNIGEELFKTYCKQNEIYCYKLGFEENLMLDNFWKINPIIRNLPDFYITKNGRSALVNVKGTASIKYNEINIIDEMNKSYGSQDVPLMYCFCFENKKPIFMNIDELKKKFAEGIDGVWKDGKKYKRINLNS